MTVQNTNFANVRLNIPYGFGHFFLGAAVAFATTKIAALVLCKLYERPDSTERKEWNKGWDAGFESGKDKVLRDVALITGIAAGCGSGFMLLPYSTLVECSSSTFFKTVGIVTSLVGPAALTRNPKVIFYTCISSFVILMGPAIGLAGRVSLVLFSLVGSAFGSELGRT